uniref:DUF7722 domain-containing protein n=1 Tax=Kalanchoe fedtschenkoi TaxID=63787 RepID=A0A7N0TQM8_KALFE
MHATMVNWVVYLWCSIITGTGTSTGTGGEPVKQLCNGGDCSGKKSTGFQMPLQYPRFTRSDYEKMDESRLKLLLAEYGLTVEGGLDELRAYAIGAFLWPNQH